MKYNVLIFEINVENANNANAKFTGLIAYEPEQCLFNFTMALFINEMRTLNTEKEFEAKVCQFKATIFIVVYQL